jgi:Protein of unknown function (DUF3102)
MNLDTKPTTSLAARIRAGHSAVIEAKKNIVRKAIEVGLLLKEAKEKECKHGQWLDWLKTNAPEISERTAQRYMELADRKQELEEALKSKSATMADLTLNGAFELLKPEPEADADDDDAEEETKEEDDETSDRASDDYDKAEERLMKKLENLRPDEAEAAIAITIRRLRDTVATMKKAAAAVEKKAA